MNYKIFQFNKKNNKNKKIIAAALVIFLFGLFLFFDLIFLAPSGGFPKGAIVKIEEGLTSAQISDFLEKQEVVKSSLMFRLTVSILGGEKNIKAGDYLFDKPYSAFEIANKVIAGDYGIEYAKILIREGETVENIGRIFEKEGLFKKEELFAVAGCCAGKILPINSLKMTEVALPSTSILEGFLFPDTYLFPKNISAEEAVKTILKNFNQKFNKALSDIALFTEVGRPSYEILIMASILEKEAVTEEDKRMISDILWRRLAKKMPLQVDATLQYITGRNTFELTKDDLKIDSPYNTYRYAGLPITPISNPGLDSIKAAAVLLSNDYWYYLSDRKGEIHYSETFEKHKMKKAEYLQSF